MIEKEIKDLNVVFGGCARDCEKYIEKVMFNIDYWSSYFNSSYKIIVENGSKDNTKNLLKEHTKINDYLFNFNIDSIRNKKSIHRKVRINKIYKFIVFK